VRKSSCERRRFGSLPGGEKEKDMRVSITSAGKSCLLLSHLPRGRVSHVSSHLALHLYGQISEKNWQRSPRQVLQACKVPSSHLTLSYILTHSQRTRLSCPFRFQVNPIEQEICILGVRTMHHRFVCRSRRMASGSQQIHACK
jgi:hypothetical protein